MKMVNDQVILISYLDFLNKKFTKCFVLSILMIPW